MKETERQDERTTKNTIFGYIPPNYTGPLMMMTALQSPCEFLTVCVNIHTVKVRIWNMFNQAEDVNPQERTIWMMSVENYILLQVDINTEAVVA